MATSAGPSDTIRPSNTGLTSPSFKKPVVANVSLSNLLTLEGKSNYQVWSDQRVMIFKTTGLYDVAVLGTSCPDGNSDIEAYREIKSAAMIKVIQLISQQILAKCNRIYDPYELWTHLKSQYYSDSPYSFVHQMHSLFTIGSSFDSTQPVSDFIETYESEWASLSTLSASGGESSYRNKLNDFLACDEAKRDILLSILIPHMSNVIDNIITKQTMTFNEAKHHLSSLPSSEFQQTAFLSAKSRRAIQRKSSKTYTDAEKKKVCNWCKKHGYPCEGHLWFQCRRLKEEQAKRKKQKEKDQQDQKGKGKADKDIKPESAHVSMEVGQSSSQFELLSGQQKLSVGSNQPSASTDQPSATTDVALTAVSTHHKHENHWIFDTTASSHMTSDLSRFETFSANTGTIEVAGETFLEYKGKGSCLVYPLYPDGTTSVVSLINVLYVPTLGHNLISWNVLRNRFLCLMGENHVYVKDTRDASQPLILHGLFRGNLPFLVESKPNAFLVECNGGLWTWCKGSRERAFLEPKP